MCIRDSRQVEIEVPAIDTVKRVCPKFDLEIQISRCAFSHTGTALSAEADVLAFADALRDGYVENPLPGDDMAVHVHSGNPQSDGAGCALVSVFQVNEHLGMVVLTLGCLLYTSDA